MSWLMYVQYHSINLPSDTTDLSQKVLQVRDVALTQTCYRLNLFAYKV